MQHLANNLASTQQTQCTTAKSALRHRACWVQAHTPQHTQLPVPPNAPAPRQQRLHQSTMPLHLPAGGKVVQHHHTRCVWAQRSIVTHRPHSKCHTREDAHLPRVIMLQVESDKGSSRSTVCLQLAACNTKQLHDRLQTRLQTRLLAQLPWAARAAAYAATACLNTRP